MKCAHRGVVPGSMVAFLVALSGTALAQAPSGAAPAQSGSASSAKNAPLKPEQLEALVAPIALYPDPVLAQVLMASTYPLEIVEAARWSKDNPKVQGKDLESAMLKQSWDASVKSLCSFPDTLAMMNDKLDWTQSLGDAFLAQQGEVMDAVQRLRAKAEAAGNLKSNKEQTVTKEKAQPPPADAGVPAQAAPQVIVIQPANPQVVYVPVYSPTVVYGTWAYPAYPPPPVYPPGYVAGAAVISFGVGLAVGAAMWGNCGWGYHGHSSVNINVNNYNRYNHTNISNNNNRNSNWQHNPQHRQGVGYRDSGTQQKYGKGQASNTAARNEFRGKAEQGRQDISRGGGASNFQPSQGAGAGGAGNRAGGGASAKNTGAGGAGTRAGGGSAGGSGAAAQRGGGGGGAAAQRGGGGGGSAFGGSGHGGQARAASTRGNASFGGGGHGGGGRRR